MDLSMRTLPEVELAITHLQRAKELAEFYQWPTYGPQTYQRICSLLRQACEVRRQMLPEGGRPELAGRIA
jgi:hypothetical protein